MTRPLCALLAAAQSYQPLIEGGFDIVNQKRGQSEFPGLRRSAVIVKIVLGRYLGTMSPSVLRWASIGGMLLAIVLWADGAGANPIPVQSNDLARDPAAASGVVTLVCIAALLAESACVALLSGRRTMQAVLTWLTVTFVTFLVFIVMPTGDWAPIGPSGARLANVLVAEALIVLVESVVLWFMWFPRTFAAAVRALGVSALGNLLSLAVGGLYALAA